MDDKICRDYGDRSGCLRTADERYTMHFDDLGEPPIYWCAKCGPEANAMSKALTEAFETKGPEFNKEFSEAISRVEDSRIKH